MNAVKAMSEIKRRETVITEFENLAVGSLVTSTTKSCLVHGEHEVGMVYEVYDMCGQKGVSILFENGRYDGWSESDFGTFGLRGLGQASNPTYSSYRFENVTVLGNQYRAGAFAEAFAEAKDQVGALREISPWWWRSF